MEPKPAGINILNQEICTRDDVMDTYSWPAFARRGCAVLDAQHIFPLTYKNPKLAPLNVVGLYVYFSGALSIERNHGYNAKIAFKKKRHHDLRHTVKTLLGLTLNKRQEFGRNGAMYARLLAAMGFHVSNGSHHNLERKATTGSELPQYLTTLITQYDQLTYNSKVVCRKYLRDLVSAAFDTKAYFSKQPDHPEVRLYMLYQPTPELVEKQGQQLIRAVNIMYPAVGMHEDQLTVQKKSQRQRYRGHITIPLEQAVLFPRGGNAASSLEFRITPKPSKYSFETGGFKTLP